MKRVKIAVALLGLASFSYGAVVVAPKKPAKAKVVKKVVVKPVTPKLWFFKPKVKK